MNNYHDRLGIKECLTTDGYMELIKASQDMGAEHQAPKELVNVIHDFGPHLIHERWLRNENKGQRTEPFYGISAFTRRTGTGYPPAGHGEGRDWVSDPDNNRHSCACITHGTIRFEVPIEKFHEVALHAISHTPCLDIMSERSQKKNSLEYQRQVDECRRANIAPNYPHDPYIEMVDLEELIHKGLVWKKGNWGWFLKENNHAYTSGTTSMDRRS